MTNPEAMIVIMLGGDPASIDLTPDEASDDRYERLFARIDGVVTAMRDSDQQMVDVAAAKLFESLAEDFGELPDAEDSDQSRVIISGLFANPRELEDLAGNVIEVIHDTAINVGVVRSLIYSYGVEIADELLLPWMMRYRTFMVV